MSKKTNLPAVKGENFVLPAVADEKLTLSP